MKIINDAKEHSIRLMLDQQKTENLEAIPNKPNVKDI